MKKLFTALCVMLGFFAAAQAQTLAAANQTFESGLFNQAVAEYEPFLTSKNQDDRAEATLKTALALEYAYKYDEAAKFIYSAPRPKGNDWRARYYAIKANILAQSPYKYYSSEIEESTTDPAKFTYQQRQQAINESYKNLWAMRRKLVDMPFADFAPYVQRYPLNSAEAALTPTVFDHFVNIWLAQNTARAADIYKQAYSLGGKTRAAVREYWRVQSIMAELKPEAKDNLPAADLLAMISGAHKVQTDDAQTLLKLKVKDPQYFEAKDVLGQAYAALQAGQLYLAAERYQTALDTADYCALLPLNHFTNQCLNLIKQITAPQLYLQKTPDFNVPVEKSAKATVRVANLDIIYLHLYKLSTKDFELDNKQYSANLPWQKQQALLAAKPERTLTLGLTYPAPYAPMEAGVEIPYSSHGFYAAFISQTPQPTDKDAIIYLNFTQIAAYGTSYALTNDLAAQRLNGGAYNIYALDAATGAGIGGATVNARGKKYTTGVNGRMRLQTGNVEHDSTSFLLQHEQNQAILPSISYNKNTPQKYFVFINTDRAIYRPGQEVKIKVNAAERKVLDYSAYSGKEKVTLTLRSPNWQEISTATLTLDDMGGADTNLTLPEGEMLGYYTIDARLGKDLASGTQAISVEEYKRPEFEVNLNKQEGVFSYGDKLTLSGKAAYYTGAPAAKALVKYEIRKSYFIPWFVSWWRPVPTPASKPISGEVKTDKNGDFKITFTPQQEADLEPELKNRPSRYALTVFVTDEGGRTLRGSASYTVSGQKYFFTTKINKGFFRAGQAGNTITAQMVNADEGLLAGTATARLYTAAIDESAGDDTITPMPLIKILPPAGNMPRLVEGDEIAQIPLAFGADGTPTAISLPQMAEGYYILKITAPNGDEGKTSFMVVDVKNPQIKLPGAVTIAENSEYYPGETAIILIGAAGAQGPKYAEVYKDQFLASAQTLHTPGPAVLEAPILPEHRGGVNINWFSVYDYKGYSGNLRLAVPYRNSEVKLKLTAPATAEPGQKVGAALEAADANGAPLKARAVVTVYDKSLDYYRKHGLDFPLLYEANQNRGYNPMQTSLQQNYAYYGRPEVYDIRRSIAPAARGIVTDEGEMFAMATFDAAPAMGAVLNKAVAAPAEAAVAGAADAGANAPQLRQNFAETAFWAPNLAVDGRADFSFSAPERVGQYNILAGVITKDMKTGQTDFALNIKKDLMLQLQAPRFLREGDEIELKALITNDGDTPFTAEVTLTPKIDGQDAAELLNLAITRQHVTVPAKQQASVVWPLLAPEGAGVLSFAAVARARDLSDGELQTIPLLPAAQRLAQSMTVAIEGEATDIALDIAQDKDTKLEAVHLTVDPSIIIPVLDSIPFLLRPSYDTATSLANSYLPLAILNSLYETYPDMKDAASKLKNRPTATAPWTAEEELLLGDLSSTPWYTLSKGYEKKENTINLFDSELVAKLQADAVEKLQKLQNPDGGLPWVKGGRSSLYTTLRVLDDMALARSYRVQTPDTLIKNALAYAAKNLELDLQAEATHANLSSALYAAYVLSSYPQDWHGVDLKPIMERAQDYAAYLTPLGKAHSAMIALRLGDEEKAQDYLARLFDTAQESPLTGIYWAPEPRAWLWYNDTITFHTTVTKLLLEVNPADARIPKLVKWLMFSNKATMWGGPEAAAKAVYTLLDVINAKAVLNDGKVFIINWGGEEYTQNVEPFDLSSKLTLSKYDANARPEFLQAQITRALTPADGGAPASAAPLPDFATISALYSTASPKQPLPGVMNVTKDFYLIKDKKAKKLRSGAGVNVGDEVEVRLTIATQNEFDFVLLEDPKPAAFEGDDLLSGWVYGGLGRYQEIRDAKTAFFMDAVPHGVYELKYTLRPTTPGLYNAGAAQMQSMYAPEFSTHSAGFMIEVKPRK